MPVETLEVNVQGNSDVELGIPAKRRILVRSFKVSPLNDDILDCDLQIGDCILQGVAGAVQETLGKIYEVRGQLPIRISNNLSKSASLKIEYDVSRRPSKESED